MGKASSITTKKALRQSKKRQALNKADKTRLKSQLKKVRGAGHSEQKKMMPETYAVIDKMAKKGIIHKNAASRYKSRLSRPKAAQE